jgi:hypothetical protein
MQKKSEIREPRTQKKSAAPSLLARREGRRVRRKTSGSRADGLWDKNTKTLVSTGSATSGRREIMGLLSRMTCRVLDWQDTSNMTIKSTPSVRKYKMF